MLSLGGTRSRARTAAAQARFEALGARLDTHETRALVIGARGIIGFQEGRFRPGVELCDEATQILRDHCRGLHWELSTVNSFALFSLGRLGRIKEASSRLTAAVHTPGFTID